MEYRGNLLFLKTILMCCLSVSLSMCLCFYQRLITGEWEAESALRSLLDRFTHYERRFSSSGEGLCNTRPTTFDDLEQDPDGVLLIQGGASSEALPDFEPPRSGGDGFPSGFSGERKQEETGAAFSGVDLTVVHSGHEGRHQRQNEEEGDHVDDIGEF